MSTSREKKKKKKKKKKTGGKKIGVTIFPNSVAKE